MQNLKCRLWGPAPRNSPRNSDLVACCETQESEFLTCFQEILTRVAHRSHLGKLSWSQWKDDEKRGDKHVFRKHFYIFSHLFLVSDCFFFFLSSLCLHPFTLSFGSYVTSPDEAPLTLQTQPVTPVTCFRLILAPINLVTIQLQFVIRSLMSAPLDTV